MKYVGRSAAERRSVGLQTAVWGVWVCRDGTHPRRVAGAHTIRTCLGRGGTGRLNPGTAGDSQALLGFQHLIHFTEGFLSSLKKRVIF